MKIINYKKHDYYDSAMAYLSEPDKSCIFDRKTNEYYLGNKVKFNIPYINNSLNEYKISELKTYILLFCGKVIPLIKITLLDQNTKVFYNKNDFINFMETNGYKFSKKRSFSYFGRSLISSKEGLEAFFNNQKDYSSYHHEYNSPILLFEYCYGAKEGKRNHWQYKLTVNPILKDLKVMQIIPPTEAFQEIYMFIGGVLSNTEDIPDNISDEIKRNQKGFNQFSFKTMKGDKKPRKKNRNKN
jgi:hypothetical protein